MTTRERHEVMANEMYGKTFEELNACERVEVRGAVMQEELREYDEQQMLYELEDVREMSEHTDGLVVALGNGRTIVGFEAIENEVIERFCNKGYWVVNNFLHGRPMGLGI